MRRAPTVGVVLAGSAAFLELYATQPLLPLLARTFRASAFDVGLTITAPTIAVAIFAPLIGRLADRAGLRRVIVGSAFLLTIATALAATAATLRQLIFWRLMQGLMTPGIFAGTVAYIHEEWPASRAGRATAAYMTGTIIGGFTGRAVAGLVAADVNWHASFIVLALLNLAVALALVVWLPPEQRRAHAHDHHLRGSSVVEHLRNGQLLATYAIGFCVLFTQVAMFTYVTFYLAAPPFGLSTAALGWLFVVYIVGAIVVPFAGRWIDRYGHRVGLGAAMAIGAAGALLTLVPSLPVVAAGLALCSTGVFVAQASTSSYIGAVTTRDRALAVGMYSTFYYIGGSVGGALPAALWSLGGWRACVALIVTVQMTGTAIAMACWHGSAGRLSYEMEPVP
jgi:YNFM family putative membrane transporter